MKRILFSLLVVGLLAGQAFAGMYNVDIYWSVVKDFTQQNKSTGDPGKLNLVIANPGDSGSTKYYDDATLTQYGRTMQLAVGFVGSLGDGSDTDNTAWMNIGKVSPGLSGGYDSFGGTLANDNDASWTFQWYLKTASTPYYTDSKTLGVGTQWLFTSANFGSTLDFTTVTEIGFTITGTFDGLPGSPSSPDYFHVSAVPVPGAVLLGVLGLMAAGTKLRKFV